MVKENIRVELREGLHMRPAGLLAAEMNKYQSRVTLIYGNKEIDAKSILCIMAAAIKYGEEITVECDGEDELSALGAAERLMTCRD